MARLISLLFGLFALLLLGVGIVSALWLVFGFWVIVTPLSAVIILLSVAVAKALIEDTRARKVRRLEAERRARLAEKRHLAELEAAAGIELMVDGTCGSCGAPLLAGARYCSQCRAKTALALKPRICATCATRNLDDAVYCAECGEPLLQPPEPPAVLDRPRHAKRGVLPRAMQALNTPLGLPHETHQRPEPHRKRVSSVEVL